MGMFHYECRGVVGKWVGGVRKGEVHFFVTFVTKQRAISNLCSLWRHSILY